MARESYLLHIHQIQDELLTMSKMVEEASQQAIEALKTRNISLAKQIYADDKKVNEKRFAIENEVLLLIATQQPMAHDLRQLAAMLEIAAELERMGDYAKGNCKVVVNLGNFDILVPIDEIDQMEKTAVKMLNSSISAFIHEDLEMARSIPFEDDKVDIFYKKILGKLLDLMIADREIIDHANLLMWIAHNLERMADRVTNICERTVFVVTGELFEMESKQGLIVE